MIQLLSELICLANGGHWYSLHDLMTLKQCIFCQNLKDLYGD